MPPIQTRDTVCSSYHHVYIPWHIQYVAHLTEHAPHKCWQFKMLIYSLANKNMFSIINPCWAWVITQYARLLIYTVYFRYASECIWRFVLLNIRRRKSQWNKNFFEARRWFAHYWADASHCIPCYNRKVEDDPSYISRRIIENYTHLYIWPRI